MRLHHDRKSQMSRDDGENLLSPQLTEIGLWKRQRIRSNHSSGANACLSRRFEGGPLATVGVRADVWKSQGDEDVLKPPVLPGATVNQGPHDVGPEGLERSNGACVDVQDEDGVPKVLEYLGDTMPRAQGDVALMAQSAGEHSDTEWRLVHRQPQIWSGAGAWTPSDGWGLWVGPNRLSSSKSRVTTPESLRTPSRISAGSG